MNDADPRVPAEHTFDPHPSDLASLPWTYTGLLDDVMVRYSDEYMSEDFFNRMIAKNVFFGGGMYINDGYLVNHPIARKHLVNRESLLRQMINVGFVRVLTRAKGKGDFI